ncbi:MAG: phosphohydrolase [Cyanobacteria bacterium QS_4_48_99]|nr:MAG: phosphohydrolase [Cyanobacteria bacterium QS_4_48_99]
MTELTEKFSEALAYASNLHLQQKRKGSNIPYITHLMAVANLALEHGATEIEAIAALLHDAAEDKGGSETLKTIQEKFGKEVAEIVEACSDSLADTTTGEQKLPWKQRKENYIARISTASPSVQLVSICDKLHNAASILTDYGSQGEEIWERFKGGKQDTLWYYRSLTDTFEAARRIPTPLLAQLQATVYELEQKAIPNSQL